MPSSKSQQQNNSALIDAVANDDVKGVRIALAEGADPNALFDPWKSNPIPKNRKYTALHLAVHRRNKDVVAVLLKAPSIDVNLRDAYGQTALLTATQLYLAEIVQLLLNHPNVNTTLKDRKKETAWDIARKDTTEHGDTIRSLFAKKEGTSWVEGENKRGVSSRDYSR